MIKNINICHRLLDLEEEIDDGTNVLPPNQVFELTINYPIEKPVIFKVKTRTRGMNTNDLCSRIVECYIVIYNNCEKYGVWGHSIGELFLEGVAINHETKQISIDMGS